MERERSPERDKAKQMLMESGGMIKLKDVLRLSIVGYKEEGI
nr:phage terminase small subunit-related protein [Paenibacillus sp. S02]